MGEVGLLPPLLAAAIPLATLTAVAGSVIYWHELKRRPTRTRAGQIGRAHVGTPVTNAHLVCRLLPEKKNIIYPSHQHLLSSQNTHILSNHTPTLPLCIL